MAPIGGILLDLDGVLYVDDVLIDGALAALDDLQQRQLPVRYITNTSTRTAQQVCERLCRLGLPAVPEQVFSAVEATRLWLEAHAITRIAPLVSDEVQTYLASRFELDEERPEAVVVGDIGDRWNYQLLNQAFRWLMDGAMLVCVHRNRYWQTGNALSLDIGAFVAGLEYAAAVKATLVGKPATAFFESACASLAVPPAQVLVVGDDIESDIGGAQRAGCRGVQVETGKYRAALAQRSQISPDYQIPSIAALPHLLDRL